MEVGTALRGVEAVVPRPEHPKKLGGYRILNAAKMGPRCERHQGGSGATTINCW